MKKLCLLIALALASFVWAEDIVVTINQVSAEGVGKEIGTITATDTKYGLLLKPQLTGLSAGLHGFHVHERPSCEAAKKDDKMTAAHAAGAHLETTKTEKHKGPYGDGHPGDLPALFVASDGTATLPVLAPRLKTTDLKGRSLMIHAGGDNYSDQPDPLGGGGARIACGVVK